MQLRNNELVKGAVNVKTTAYAFRTFSEFLSLVLRPRFRNYVTNIQTIQNESRCFYTSRRLFFFREENQQTYSLIH